MTLSNALGNLLNGCCCEMNHTRERTMPLALLALAVGLSANVLLGPLGLGLL